MRTEFANIRTTVKRQTPCWKQRDNQAFYADDAEMEEFQDVLKRRLRKAWTTLKNLIGSMPNRLEAVIKSKGNIIKY